MLMSTTERIARAGVAWNCRRSRTADRGPPSAVRAVRRSRLSAVRCLSAQGSNNAAQFVHRLVVHDRLDVPNGPGSVDGQLDVDTVLDDARE